MEERAGEKLFFRVPGGFKLRRVEAHTMPQESGAEFPFLAQTTFLVSVPVMQGKEGKGKSHIHLSQQLV